MIIEKAARDALAQQSMKLVDRIVAVEKRKLGHGLGADELRSYALEGLAQALDRYDPGRNVAFSTYAEPRIRGAIYDGLSQMSLFPRSLARNIRFYRQCEEMLHYQGDAPLPSDQVEAAHQLADRLKELATAYVTSYVSETNEEAAYAPAEAEYFLERKRFSAKLRSAVKRLPRKQQAVVESYYFEEMNLIEISKKMGISKGWASKLLSAGLQGLRKSFDEAPSSLDALQPPLRR